MIALGIGVLALGVTYRIGTLNRMGAGFIPVVLGMLFILVGLAIGPTACAATQRRGGPTYSSSYFVPQTEGTGVEMMDLCVAERDAGRIVDYVIASYSLPGLLDQLSAPSLAPGNDLSFVEGDGARLAHSRQHVGAGV